jgi:hypothetical protein
MRPAALNWCDRCDMLTSRRNLAWRPRRTPHRGYSLTPNRHDSHRSCTAPLHRSRMSIPSGDRRPPETQFHRLKSLYFLGYSIKLLVSGSQLVCDPLGEVVNRSVGYRLVGLPVEKVSLFSIGNPAVESPEGGLGQNI